jgi:hypothetical protein
VRLMYQLKSVLK